MFRFTIRDVLWLTVVVALGMALWLQHGIAMSERAAREQSEALWSEQASKITEGVAELLKRVADLEAEREAARQVSSQTAR